MSAAQVAREMEKSEVSLVHLAVNPFVDPLAVVPGTAGETENVGGTGGVDSIDKQRSDIEELLASGKWQISSTLFNSRYDDYSTLESIRATGGLVPDEHWEENRVLVEKVIRLSAQWKSPYVMLHAGFINHVDKVGFAKLTDRLKYVRDICADAGTELTLETGQETADDLAAMLVDLPGVYVNFDPANMILYGKGDFAKSICIAVQNGFDTDCNGATVGSICGIMNGIDGIGKEWYEGFNGTLATSLCSYPRVSLDEYVEKTMKHIQGDPRQA